MKLRSAILRFFPPPLFFAMPAVGIDISDRSIKYMVLSSEYGSPHLVDYGESVLSPGIVEGGKVLDSSQLGKELQKVCKKLSGREIILALPEERAYAFSLTIPAMARRDIRTSIELQLENQIPVPAQGVLFDYDVIQERSDGGFGVVVSAISREDVEGYREACKGASLLPRAFEIEAHAIVRALLDCRTTETVLIVDMGKTRTGLIVSVNGNVAFTSTVQGVGGEDITTVVQKSLKVSRDIAEQYKIERGLSRSKENRDIFFALIPIVSVLKDEIMRRREYWNVHEGKSQDSTLEPINRIILTGGQATLPGFDEYLSENLGCPVDVVSPWLHITHFDDGIPPLSLNESLGYTTAIGLALRGLATPIG